VHQELTTTKEVINLVDRSKCILQIIILLRTAMLQHLNAMALLATLAAATAPSGTYEGSVPLILDMTVTFNSDGTMDFDNNIKVAHPHQEIKCQKVSIAVSDSAVTFPNIQKTGDCLGDALRKQHKDVTKFSIGINADGTLTFHSTWPDLKLKKKSDQELTAPTGTYEGSVPFILDLTCTFNSDGTMDFDNNVKVAHQEIKCPKVAISVSDTAITFPNIKNTGDCMGDALRKQKKDVTKFSLSINSDGSLTFHSTWPDLKLKKKAFIVV